MMQNENIDELRVRRKTRNRTSDVGLKQVFNDFSKSPEDQAMDGLRILDEKVTEDLAEQFREVREGVAPQRELERLLRMMEKRKNALDKMYEAVVLDDQLMSAANTMILQWNQAEN